MSQLFILKESRSSSNVNNFQVPGSPNGSIPRLLLEGNYAAPHIFEPLFSFVIFPLLISAPAEPTLTVPIGPGWGWLGMTNFHENYVLRSLEQSLELESTNNDLGNKNRKGTAK